MNVCWKKTYSKIGSKATTLENRQLADHGLQKNPPHFTGRTESTYWGVACDFTGRLFHKVIKTHGCELPDSGAVCCAYATGQQQRTVAKCSNSSLAVPFGDFLSHGGTQNWMVYEGKT